jgi:uncharacterized protein (DUF433 family)
VQLEDYFEFQSPEYTRVKGTRVPIDVLIEEFNRGAAPDKIQASYPTTTLEQVYATITYYLHNHSQVDEYLRQGREKAEAAYQEHLRRQPPSALAEKLRSLRETSPISSQAAS